MALRLGPHAAAVRGDDPLREVETQSRPGDVPGRFRPVAATEEPSQLGAVESYPLVLHGDRRGPLASGDRDRHGRALRRVLQRVRDEIHEDLPDPSLGPFADDALVGDAPDLVVDARADAPGPLAGE